MAIAQRKRKLTKSSKQILKFFEGGHVSLSAQDIYQKLKGKIDRATVYRNINTLCLEGYLVKVHFQGEITRYELIELGHHHHLICNKCKNIISITTEILGPSFESISEDAKSRYGFTILDHELEFYGLCENCKDKGDEKDGD